MSTKDIIRAWKDEAFREHMGDITLPEHPAGQIELTDESLTGIQGGLLPTATICSLEVCTIKTAPEIC